MATFPCPYCEEPIVKDEAKTRSARCDACGHVIPTSSQAEAPAPPLMPLDPTDDGDDPLRQLEQTALGPRPSEDPFSASVEWRCIVAGEEYGPVNEYELISWIQDDILTSDDLVWTGGMDRWHPVCEVPRLMSRALRQPPRGAPASQSTKTLSVLAIVFGAIAFLFFPPLFGIGGIICASIAISKAAPHQKTLATTGLIISVLGLVLGMLFGILVMASMR